MHAAERGSRGAHQCAFARRQTRGLHPQRQPLGARSGNRERPPAHDRRCERLWLRHRQRRLDEERPPGARVVRRLQKDCDVSAGSARRGRDVPGRHARWASGARAMEVPAARRQHHPDDSARHHRPRRTARDQAPDGARSASVADVEWSGDRSRLAFVSTSRDHKHETLRVADASTGAVRDVLQESVPTFYESGYNAENWRVLDTLKQVLWYSERDNWGNLYLYDLASGALVKRITTGPGNVLQVLRVDQKDKTIYFTSAGREPGTDPYFV